MKKVVCFLCALLLCLGMSFSVFAAGTEFVPSISYKDGPDIQTASLDGEDVDDCLVVTSIKEANEKTTDIHQDTRDELVDVYKDLSEGKSDLGLGNGYVVRELVDVSFKYEDCETDEEHGDKAEELQQSGKTLEVDFDLGVAAGTDVVVMTYIDGKWQKIESVVNNGDGTVTCVFEDICPVAFAVKESTASPNLPQTGDPVGQSLYLWIGALVLSGAALVTLIVVASKKKAQ